MKKTNFDPNKIKCLLEYKGLGRYTDEELAKMWNVKKNTIARWKIQSPALFDKIHDTGLTFFQLVEMPNQDLINLLKLHPNQVYKWNKKRPSLLINAESFFIVTGIKFEEIYKKE